MWLPTCWKCEWVCAWIQSGADLDNRLDRGRGDIWSWGSSCFLPLITIHTVGYSWSRSGRRNNMSRINYECSPVCDARTRRHTAVAVYLRKLRPRWLGSCFRTRPGIHTEVEECSVGGASHPLLIHRYNEKVTHAITCCGQWIPIITCLCLHWQKIR